MLVSALIDNTKWVRVGTVLSPTNLGDDVSTTGTGIFGALTINTTLTMSSGLIEDSGLLISFGSTNLLTMGNVGIGTASASSALHVSGGAGSVNVLIEADTDNTDESFQPSLTFSQDGGGVTGALGYFDSNNSFKLINNFGGSFIALGPSGFVGIGLSSPTEALHILGPRVKIQRSTTSSGQSAELGFTITPTPSVAATSFIRVFRRTDFDDNDMLFNVGTTDVMWLIGSTGFIGIGTASPSTLLQVVGTIGYDILQDNSLEAFWQAVDKTIALDSTENGHDGSFQGSASTAKDILNFDGTGDYIDLVDMTELNGTSALTVAMWIRINSGAAGDLELWDRWDTTPNKFFKTRYLPGTGFRGFFSEDGTSQGGGTFASTTISTEEWHHAVFVYDGTELKFFLDGDQSATTFAAFAGTLSTVSTTTVIGTDSGNPGSAKQMDGALDDIMVFKRALTDAEIQQIYERGNKQFGHFNEAVIGTVTATTVNATTVTATGTVSGEQITSTDDMTMQGHLLTLGDGTDTIIIISFSGSSDTGVLLYDPSAGKFTFDDEVLIDNDLVVSNDTTTTVLFLNETSTPTPVANDGAIWTTSDNELFFQDGSGVSHLLHGDAFSNIWFHGASTVEVTISTQDAFAKIDSFAVVGHEDDLSNVVGSAGTDNLTLSSIGGGEYEVSFHGSVTATGGADKEMLIALGITLATPKDITNVTDNTITPIVITSVAHGLENGDMVEIVGVLGNTAANGSFIVDSKADDTFQIVALDGGATTGNGDYNEGSPTGDVTIEYPGNMIVHRMVRGADLGAVSATGLHVLADSDVLALYVANLSGTTNLTVAAISLGAFRIGD